MLTLDQLLGSTGLHLLHEVVGQLPADSAFGHLARTFDVVGFVVVFRRWSLQTLLWSDVGNSDGFRWGRQLRRAACPHGVSTENVVPELGSGLCWVCIGESSVPRFLSLLPGVLM